MYRQLYQMGGIGTLPMDYGQSLQVNNQAQMPIPNYSSAVNITANPLLNYGQTPLANGGGTPLTMRSGGMTRLGYQEGGMGMVEDQAMMQPQQAPQIKDPKQALELIIQMLIEQGIPPEQAREIAIQMVQAVAEGGMGEMEDQRIEARFGGSINGRTQYGIGSIISAPFKAIGSAVKGITNAVKSVVKSDLGKAALTVAAIYASGGGFSPEGFSFLGDAATGSAGLLGSGGQFNLGNSYLGQNLFGTSVSGMDFVDGGAKQGFLGKLGITSGYGADLLPAGIKSLIPSSSTLTTLGLGTLFGKVLGGQPRREDYGSDEEYQQALAQWNATLSTKLNEPKPKFAAGLFPNNPFYPQMAANGGRIGYQSGGIGDLVSQVTKQEFFGTPMMAMGGRMGYAMGKEVPTRQNQAGITELDYRDTGGFVPPIGIKERADDIPAMLSNNEFVFTADAVRNAGGGDENLGAKRMYALMKNLEAGGSV